MTTATQTAEEQTAATLTPQDHIAAMDGAIVEIKALCAELDGLDDQVIRARGKVSTAENALSAETDFKKRRALQSAIQDAVEEQAGVGILRQEVGRKMAGLCKQYAAASLAYHETAVPHLDSVKVALRAEMEDTAARFEAAEQASYRGGGSNERARQLLANADDWNQTPEQLSEYALSTHESLQTVIKTVGNIQPQPTTAAATIKETN